MKRRTAIESVGRWAVAASLVAIVGCDVIPDSAGPSRDSLANLAGSRGETGDLGALPAGQEPIDLSEFGDGVEAFAAFKTTELDVIGTRLPARGPVTNVMDDKLNDAITTLADPANDETIHQAAVDQIMEALFMSNLVVLPTPNVSEEDQLVADHELALQNAINALNQHIDPIGPAGGPNSKGDAWDARNFLQVMQEALNVVGQATAQCDPLNLRDPLCEGLLDGDEGGVDVDNVFPGFSRQVRSPFFIGADSAVGTEVVIVPDVIGPDECVVILKEIQGVKAVVRKIQIPIWVEPWFARASIVGFRTVWVWEFIPAEFLKTISYCNSAGSVTQDVDITVVLERELMHFWSFMNLNVVTSP